jgi:ferredoxin
MKVWIDQDLCTGDGLCVFSDPGGAAGLANIPDGQLDGVIESAEECPGECIFIEVE